VRYCADRALLTPVFIEDTASGRTDWRDRPLGQLLTRAARGDVIVVAEVSRLARSTLQVLEISRECIERGVHLHVAKTGLVAEIERDFISARTKEALAKRKADGMKLGRPSGPARSLRLDAHADKIDKYLAKGIDKSSVAKLLDVAPNTLYAWLKVRRSGAGAQRTV